MFSVCQRALSLFEDLHRKRRLEVNGEPLEQAKLHAFQNTFGTLFEYFILHTLSFFSESQRTLFFAKPSIF